MTNVPPHPANGSLPPLRFADLHVGMTFAPQTLAVTSALVDGFAELTGDDNPLYRDAETARAAGLPGPVMPPGLAGVWARRSYLARHRMLPGGVMAGQELRFIAPVTVGTALTLGARVLEHDASDPKRRVLLECTAAGHDGDLAGQVRIDARWPQDGPDA